MGQRAPVRELRASAALTTSFVDTNDIGVDGKDSILGAFTYQVKDAAGATGVEVQVWLSDLDAPATDDDYYQLTREEATAASGTVTLYAVTYVFPLPAGAINDDIYRFGIPVAIGDKRAKFKVRETGAPATPGLLGAKVTLRTLGANG